MPDGENEQSEQNRASDNNRPTEEIEPLINDNNAIEENEQSRDD